VSYRNKQELIALLQKHGLWTKKSLGQNFLVNPQVIGKIIDSAQISAHDRIVEVGPGLGILTQALLSRAAHVRAIEYDQKLIPLLQKTFAPALGHTLELIHADALATPLPAYDYKLVANIPYYITSPLLNHFLQPDTVAKRPTLIVLLVQKEVAEKICASEPDHSILSLQIQIFGRPEIVAIVSKTNFFPQPKVDSAILKITTYQEPLIQNLKTFFQLIKGTFAQKRKTLSNSLRSTLALSREQVLALLLGAGIAANRRPQSLSINEWQKLTEITSCHEDGLNSDDP